MIIFVYNADSGLFNTLTDIAHKIFSPETYSCNLCAITYGTFAIREEWQVFLETLDRPMEFLHRDEFHERYGMVDLDLPAILLKADGRIDVLIPANDINRCPDIQALKSLLQAKLAA